MRPHLTYSITSPSTHRYINDYIDNEISHTPTPLPIRRASKFPTAILVLALGLGLAIMMMLGTWLSLSPQATARITTFVAHPEDPTQSANALAEMGLPPIFFEDIFTHF